MLRGVFGEHLELLLLVLFFVLSLTFINVLLAILQHAIHQSRQLGGHRGDRLGRTQSAL